METRVSHSSWLLHILGHKRLLESPSLTTQAEPSCLTQVEQKKSSKAVCSEHI